ncbi:hypothetical protein BGZ61DRAFT_120652 [Ilyonectria robusta]|uniref:uncharacterized protein n=1 Tax=Ilyonectria robusta TaxID=1079257 RepID=UPI001E8DB2EF|nr:uncharacterized protein BGZ61DRAFT_120652 [Ilyonectria robusta]KAH8667308.1 hypothetical protein BGZ61DRAFT_120652 [Ilyonectria robusta]
MRQGKWILQQFSGLTSVNQTPSVPYLPPRNSRSAPTSKQPVTSLPSPPHPHADGCPALRATLSLVRGRESVFLAHYSPPCPVCRSIRGKQDHHCRPIRKDSAEQFATNTHADRRHLSAIFHLISRGWMLLLRPWLAITRNGTDASSRGIIVLMRNMHGSRMHAISWPPCHYFSHNPSTILLYFVHLDGPQSVSFRNICLSIFNYDQYFCCC